MVINLRAQLGSWWGQCKPWVLPAVITSLVIGVVLAWVYVPSVQTLAAGLVQKSETITREIPVVDEVIHEKVATLEGMQAAQATEIAQIRSDHERLLTEYQAAIHELSQVYDSLQKQQARIATSTSPEFQVEGGTRVVVEGKIAINTANAEALQTLSGVGPKLAEAIVQYRTEHGPFTALEQLDSVSGIGPALLEKILPLVTL